MEQLINIFAIDLWIPDRGTKIKKECDISIEQSRTERLKRLIKAKAKVKQQNTEVFLHYKKLAS